jgi:hypothetical protein
MQNLDDTFPTYLTDKRMSVNGRKSSPKSLRSLNHEILRLSLLGWKGTEIAKHLGITPITVSNTLNSPKGRAVLIGMNQARAERTVDIAEDMRIFAPKALDVWKECIADPEGVVPMPVRAREAREFLGVCGYVKPQRVESHTVHTHLTLEEIQELKEKARARAIASGVVAPKNEQDEVIEIEGQVHLIESVGASLRFESDPSDESERKVTGGDKQLCLP